MTFSLNPLAAALQGVGFGTFLMAIQGLFAITVGPELEQLGSMGAFRPKRRVKSRAISSFAFPAPRDEVRLARQVADDLELLQAIAPKSLSSKIVSVFR